MKHIHSTIFSYTCLLALVLVSTFSFTSCDDDETYADRRKRNNRRINFILN